MVTLEISYYWRTFFEKTCIKEEERPGKPQFICNSNSKQQQQSISFIKLRMKLISSIIVASVSTSSMAANIGRRDSRFIDGNIDYASLQHELDAIEAVDQMIADEIGSWQADQWDIFWDELDQMVTDYEIINDIVDDPFVFEFADLLNQ